VGFGPLEVGLVYYIEGGEGVVVEWEELLGERVCREERGEGVDDAFGEDLEARVMGEGRREVKGSGFLGGVGEGEEGALDEPNKPARREEM
jgi:hypothetical protein